MSEADVEEGFIGETDADENQEPRAPVVTIMGHVDHGKTSLLDAIRHTNVAAGEAGGITQHIGAYQVTTPDGQKITFIDTPGHEAFTAMRARGAKVTDIVVLVVAADDGVMPQTVEAINHAKAAGVPMIVAINKIDKPDADPNRVRTDLLQHEIVVESMSGETLEVEVSALKKTGLDKLLEAISLQAELLDLKANPDRSAEGVVIEAKLERGRGPVGTVLVQRGTLRVGDIVVAGSRLGARARADRRSRRDRHGGRAVGAGRDPGLRLRARGRRPVRRRRERGPRARDHRLPRAQAAPDAGLGRHRAHARADDAAAQGGRAARSSRCVVKGDVQGSVEAIAGALRKLGTDEVEARIVHSGVGGITESDVALANASKAVVVGFNVRANAQAKAAADQAGVEIRYYNIIYDLVDDVKAAMSGLLSPTLREIFLGNAADPGGVQHLQGRQGRRLPRHRRQGRARRQGAPDPRQRGDPRRHAVDAQALQGRGARGAGRPGVRHGVRQLPGHPRRRRHRVLQRRDHRPHALMRLIGVRPTGSDTSLPGSAQWCQARRV